MKKVILKLVLSLLLASGVLVNLPVYGRGQFTNLWSYVGPDLSNTVSLERIAFVTAVAIVTGMLFYWNQWKHSQSKPLEEGDIPKRQARMDLSNEQKCMPEIIINEQEAFDILASVRGQLDTLWAQVEAQELPFDQVSTKFETLKTKNRVLGGFVAKLLESPDMLYGKLSQEYQGNLTGVDPRSYYTRVGVNTIQEGTCLTSAQMLEKIDREITHGIGKHDKEFVQRQLIYIFSEPWSKKFYDLWLQGEPQLINKSIKRVSNSRLHEEYQAMSNDESSLMKLSTYVANQRDKERKKRSEQEWVIINN